MPEPTVGQIVTDYLENKVAQMRAGLISKEAVIRAHTYCLAFAASYGHQPVSQCRRGDIKRWLLLHPEWHSPYTMHDAAGAIVTCFRWAADDGLIALCPYTKPRDLPALEPRQPITGEEVKLILASAHGYGHRPTRRAFRLAIWFLWETGCRTCELRRLCWEHYDDTRGVFELRGKSTHKTGRRRMLVLTKRAWRFIRWFRRGQTSGPVFLNGRGRVWNKDSFARLFRRHARVAGLREELTAYCLRHGFACEMLEAGVGERQIADLMGHSSTRYINWYGRGVKSRVDYLRDMADKRKK